MTVLRGETFYSKESHLSRYFKSQIWSLLFLSNFIYYHFHARSLPIVSTSNFRNSEDLLNVVNCYRNWWQLNQRVFITIGVYTSKTLISTNVRSDTIRSLDHIAASDHLQRCHRSLNSAREGDTPVPNTASCGCGWLDTKRTMTVVVRPVNVSLSFLVVIKCATLAPNDKIKQCYRSLFIEK